MGFLNNIKKNYHIKVLEDNIKNHKYKEVHSLLNKLFENDPSSFYQILKNLNDLFLLKTEHSDFYLDKKYIWINSFEEEDTIFFKKFINYYFSKIGLKYYIVDHFGSLFNQLRIKNSFNEINNLIDFGQFSQNSNFYQTALFYLSKSQLLATSSMTAFFETIGDQKKYPINHSSTICYFLLVNNPINIFNRNKIKDNSSQSAFNTLFNYDQKIHKTIFNENDKKMIFEENRQNWNTHTSSWIDPNVQSGFKGKIINLEEFPSNLEEELASIVFHLKQHGLDNLDVNYDIIKSFLNENIVEKTQSAGLSNQEKKVFSRDINQNLLNHFNFKI